MKVRGGFHVRVMDGHIVEVWLGVPGAAESDRVVCVDQSLLPAVLAALKAAGCVGRG